MAFIKVRDKKDKETSIINTDMICRISKTKSGYMVFFSSGNVGAAYYEYDKEEAIKIFEIIGVSLIWHVMFYFIWQIRSFVKIKSSSSYVNLVRFF